MIMALDYIHKKGLMHRCINLSNIFVTENAHIKLGELALPNLQLIDNDSNKLTDREYCVSPEICLNQPFSTKSDMWSLGCVMEALACFEYPFQGKTIHTLLRNIVCL
jgi:NIMA (never in mitosis gene a)-related kinase